MEKFEEVLEHLGPDYSIESDGGPIKYLLKKGARTGRGYHRFFLENGAVYGKICGKVEIIVNANGETMNNGQLVSAGKTLKTKHGPMMRAKKQCPRK